MKIIVIRANGTRRVYGNVNPDEAFGPFDTCDLCGDDVSLHESMTFDQQAVGVVRECDRSPRLVGSY